MWTDAGDDAETAPRLGGSATCMDPELGLEDAERGSCYEWWEAGRSGHAEHQEKLKIIGGIGTMTHVLTVKQDKVRFLSVSELLTRFWSSASSVCCSRAPPSPNEHRCLRPHRRRAPPSPPSSPVAALITAPIAAPSPPPSTPPLPAA
jgi:hypothetical protein